MPNYLTIKNTRLEIFHHYHLLLAALKHWRHRGRLTGKLFSRYLFTATCVAVCVYAQAQAQAQAVPAATLPVASGSLWALMQVLFALAVVIVGIFVCAALMRRLSPGMVGGAAQLKVAGAVMVGPKERVVVVELNDTWLVLGVSGVEINLLHTLPRPEGLGSAVVQPPSAFSEKLASLLARREGKA